MSGGTGTCGNCGSPDEGRSAVRRVYLEPAPVTVAEVEWWCAACTSQYPHEAA